jgi:protoheme IX farnesyltransferase
MTVYDFDASGPGVLRRAADFAALTKPRLNAMAVFAVAVGWWAEVGFAGELAPFVWAVLGAGGVAFGSSVFNQIIERDRDALMERTCERPLPAGRMSVSDAVLLGVALSMGGLAILALGSTPLATGLGALTLVSYVAIYTPLKTRTSLNTLVGTIPGALPPLIGAAAASGSLSPRAWFLFALIGIWQLPHFLSIAWLYRRDYERAGYAMLPVVTGGSGATGRQIVVQGLLTLLVSLSALPLGLAGTPYFAVALVAGVGFVATGVLFLVRGTDQAARLVLRASLLHLPLVLTAFALS